MNSEEEREFSILRDELEASSNRIGYLEAQLHDAREDCDSLDRIARRRSDLITSLEEEVADLQENLADLEAKIAGRACAGSQNCPLEQESV